MIHTIPARKARSINQRPWTTSATVTARYLVAEYLHDLGIRDPEVVAGESQRIAQHAEDLTHAIPPDLYEQELRRTAIRLTVDFVDEALHRMTERKTNSRDRIASSPTNNSIVPRMAGILWEFPGVLRQHDEPSAEVLQVLEQSVAPIVPLPKVRSMRRQTCFRLWRGLRKSYWKRVVKRMISSRKTLGFWETAK